MPQVQAVSTRKVIAKKSRLHGRGLFAARDLAAEEKLIEYTGTRHEAGDVPDLSDDGITKFLGLSDGTGINGTGWAALANHSCDPNCELREEESGTQLRAWLYALRDIAQGEELVWDYRLNVKSHKDAYSIWACHCGASNCRGTMANPENIKKPKSQQLKNKRQDKAEKHQGKKRKDKSKGKY